MKNAYCDDQSKGIPCRVRMKEGSHDMEAPTDLLGMEWGWDGGQTLPAKQANVEWIIKGQQSYYTASVHNVLISHRNSLNNVGLRMLL